MNTKLFTLLFLTCCIFNVNAQEYLNLKNNNTVTLITYFNKGDTRTYHVVKTDQDFKNNSEKASKETTETYDITLKVVDSTEKSYTIQMTYSNLSTNGNTEKDEFTREIMKMSENVKIMYSTDEIGNFKGIINKKEVLAVLSKGFELMVSKISENVKDEKEKKTIHERLAEMKKTFLTEENVDVMFSEDIICIHGSYGIELTLNKPLQYALIYPGLNGQDMNGTGTITLKEINKPKDEFKYTSVQEPNKEEVKKYVENFIKTVAGDELKTDEMKDWKYSSKTTENFSAELTTGWMKKASFTTTVVVGSTKTMHKRLSKKEFKTSL